MKVYKPLFVIFLVLLTVFTYVGHGMHDYFDHIADKIENTSSGKWAQGSIHQESPYEDETHSILPGNRFLFENFDCKRIATRDCYLPPKINITIWLPPELS